MSVGDQLGLDDNSELLDQARQKWPAWVAATPSATSRSTPCAPGDPAHLVSPYPLTVHAPRAPGRSGSGNTPAGARHLRRCRRQSSRGDGRCSGRMPPSSRGDPCRPVESAPPCPSSR